MADKQQTDNRAKSKPVCLYPHQADFVGKQALRAGISISRYFQLLADYDKKKNILPAALKQLAEELEAQNGE